jgi:hypothetical protein
MKPKENVTNERASEYDISVAFPFSSVTICNPNPAKMSQLMGMLWRAGN